MVSTQRYGHQIRGSVLDQVPSQSATDDSTMTWQNSVPDNTRHHRRQTVWAEASRVRFPDFAKRRNLISTLLTPRTDFDPRSSFYIRQLVYAPSFINLHKSHSCGQSSDSFGEFASTDIRQDLETRGLKNPVSERPTFSGSRIAGTLRLTNLTPPFHVAYIVDTLK
jgi:hypothetical protein